MHKARYRTAHHSATALKFYRNKSYPSSQHNAVGNGPLRFIAEPASRPPPWCVLGLLLHDRLLSPGCTHSANLSLQLQPPFPAIPKVSRWTTTKRSTTSQKLSARACIQRLVRSSTESRTTGQGNTGRDGDGRHSCTKDPPSAKSKSTNIMSTAPGLSMDAG